MNPHAATPTLSVIDPRTLAVRNVGYCRHPDSPVIDPRITRQRFDAAGRLVESWDPRLWGTAPKPNLITLYGLSGQPLLTDSVDGGWQLGLPDQAGSPCSFWDARGSQRRTGFDAQQRPIAVMEQVAGEAPRVVERLTYGDCAPAFAERNQCGQLIRHDDPAGVQVFLAYGLTGAVLVEDRRFLADLETPDWPLGLDERDSWLEDRSFITRHAFNPGGELQRQTDAMGNVRTVGYDRAGKLSEVWLQMAGEGKRPQRLVSAIRYNAQDQIESETAGNGVLTHAEYAADDGRLLRLVAAVGNQKPLQELNYVYDPAGNIVELQDLSQAVSHFNNQRIDPINRYRYDSLYQLVEARGWEVSQPSHGPTLPTLLPTPLDPNQRRNYTQCFEYDRGGNLISRQQSDAPRFSMFTSTRSNRSLGQRDDGSLPGEPEVALGFDACGNQQELQRGQAMTWDSRNQLHQVTLVKRETGPDDYEGYRYDRPGHRLRKVGVAHSGGRTLCSEVRYLPGLEIHRQADGEEHHVISVEAGRSSVRALHWPQGTHDDQLRFSLSDHLGSSTLELDDEAGVLTQEHYYPFGGTACWAGKSALVAKYKTIRYSGKERDATGLYYYGYRYYAPWLQHWICPDPAGEVEGPNRYAMVGNNPINFADRFGLNGEQVTGTQILGGVILMFLLTLTGAGLGWLAGNAMTGASVGALLGGALFGIVRTHEYLQLRPEAVAANQDVVERQFGEDIKNLATSLAANESLTQEETTKFSSFAFEHRNASGSDGVVLRLFHSQTGKIFGYTGPEGNVDKAWRVLSTEKNPVRGLKRLGYNTLLVRDTPKEQSSTEQSPYVESFEVEGASVSNMRKAGKTSQSGTSSVASSMAPKSVQHWEIDTHAVDSILGNSSDPCHKSVSSTISSLREGRTGALSWHRHHDGLWSADLRGFPGSTKRGVHRLMLSHQGGVHYRVEGIRNPH
ncbi:RHS repeat domain-containing protein [Pseudomonas sp. GM48]|uniref:RHS repeat domain-containing protein n=1 Tax=Pseudomonas sp. GM48 TaxID=1144330 RepID=UPI0002704192|nr:RHS repeat-associated core domain-containing protein [Pseudomonas sp. GM48]EJM59204.1 RHS repeat-associated core domain protein containing protein [Pseudomonas sp. GM48]